MDISGVVCLIAPGRRLHCLRGGFPIRGPAFFLCLWIPIPANKRIRSSISRFGVWRIVTGG